MFGVEFTRGGGGSTPALSSRLSARGIRKNRKSLLELYSQIPLKSCLFSISDENCKRKRRIQYLFARFWRKHAGEGEGGDGYALQCLNDTQTQKNLPCFLEDEEEEEVKDIETAWRSFSKGSTR